MIGRQRHMAPVHGGLQRRTGTILVVHCVEAVVAVDAMSEWYPSFLRLVEQMVGGFGGTLISIHGGQVPQHPAPLFVTHFEVGG